MSKPQASDYSTRESPDSLVSNMTQKEKDEFSRGLINNGAVVIDSNKIRTTYFTTGAGLIAYIKRRLATSHYSNRDITILYVHAKEENQQQRTKFEEKASRYGFKKTLTTLLILMLATTCTAGKDTSEYMHKIARSRQSAQGMWLPDANYLNEIRSHRNSFHTKMGQVAKNEFKVESAKANKDKLFHSEWIDVDNFYTKFAGNTSLTKLQSNLERYQIVTSQENQHEKRYSPASVGVAIKAAGQVRTGQLYSKLFHKSTLYNRVPMLS